jgi:hypothetical protein
MVRYRELGIVRKKITQAHNHSNLAELVEKKHAHNFRRNAVQNI